MPLTWREELSVRAEACLEEMRLANEHLEDLVTDLQDKLLDERRAATREKAVMRSVKKKEAGS